MCEITGLLVARSVWDRGSGEYCARLLGCLFRGRYGIVVVVNTVRDYWAACFAVGMGSW